MAVFTPASYADTSGGFFEWLSTPPSAPNGTTSARRNNASGVQASASQSGTRYDYRTYRDDSGNIDWNSYALNRVSTQEAVTTGTTRREVDFHGDYTPGSIVINTSERRLYYVLPGGRAYQYTVGVGRPGYEWYGEHDISRKAEWPDWRPPAEMRQRQPQLPAFMPGGPGNPMGARALYLGSTLYRIHGTTENQTIGYAVSSGCIRMLNEDVMDLYTRVAVGARVFVRL
jgi:lipoprotein-anchoring transpeptidase ErfK/SrfK